MRVCIDVCRRGRVVDVGETPSRKVCSSAIQFSSFALLSQVYSDVFVLESRETRCLSDGCAAGT